MSAALNYLSLEQFEELYRDQKPNYEYWFGEAVQKSMPVKLHGKLQWIIAMLLARLGWDSSVETRLKLSRLAQPVPDVIADHAILGEPYPIERFDLCVEVLSPGDRLEKVFAKCAHYLDWGVHSAWIIDGENRRAFVMSIESPVPVEIGIDGVLHAGAVKPIALPLTQIFEELDRSIPTSAE